VDYFVYAVLVYVIASRRYGFVFSRECSLSFALQLALVAGALSIVLLLPAPVKYWACAAATVISCVYALCMLERKTGILAMVKERIHHGKN